MFSEVLRYPRLQLASDCSVLVTFGINISREHHRDVVRLFTLLLSERHPAIRNLHPAYCSLLITFDPLVADPHHFRDFIHGLVERIDSVLLPMSRVVEIPVCYDTALGPDLQFVASHNHISVAEVIRYHSSTEYLVYFLGFSPGFPYLGELPKQLFAPRLPTPRVKVPAGSVAIGGNQTGIYPADSPGGWRIIGRTPLKLFRAERSEPALLHMGDIVRFVPITRREFDEMALLSMNQWRVA